MKIEATSVEEYIAQIPEERKPSFEKLCKTVSENLPEGFETGMSYGMIAWSVPLEAYPDGYHCKANTPLPFISLGSQKNFIALYHMGIYAKPDLLEWFVEEFPKHSSRKLDMGKSCIRFKKPGDIPFGLIAELCKKITVAEWIDVYESLFRK